MCRNCQLYSVPRKENVHEEPQSFLYLEHLESTLVASAYPVSMAGCASYAHGTLGMTENICAVTAPGQPEAKGSMRPVSQVSSFLGASLSDITGSVTAVLTCAGAGSALVSAVNPQVAASLVFTSPGRRCCYSHVPRRN